MMFWSIAAVAIAALVLGWLLFQPINLWLPDNKKNSPGKEVHETEDLRQYPMEDNLDVKAHYHAKEEDAVK